FSFVVALLSSPLSARKPLQPSFVVAPVFSTNWENGHHSPQPYHYPDISCQL
ncbi:hypothetical protein ACLOJK_039586, partial [Asimina triloba]